jgi:hypothetical protein
MHGEAPEAVFDKIFLPYFALNLQSAHKMWGRMFNQFKERKILWNTSTKSS